MKTMQKKKNCFLKIDVVLIILYGLNFGKCFTLVIVVCPGDHASNFLQTLGCRIAKCLVYYVKLKQNSINSLSLKNRSIFTVSKTIR